MSFSFAAAYSPHKDSDLFGQSFDGLGDEYFDQFVTFSPIDNEETDYPILPKSPLLERLVSASYGSGTLSSLQDAEVDHPAVQRRCRGEPWEFAQKPASSPLMLTLDKHHLYSELSGRAAISDSELLSLEGITLYSPQVPAYAPASQPSTPTPSAIASLQRKSRFVQSLSNKLKKATGSFDRTLRSPIRKSSSASKMMCASHYANHGVDMWEPKANMDGSKYDYEFQHTGPLSPPASARQSNASENPHTMSSQYHDQFAYDIGLSQFASRPISYETPLATPTLDAQHSRRPSVQQSSSDNMLFSSAAQHQQASPTWPPLSEAAEFNPYAPSRAYLSDVDAPIWWNHAAAAPVAQPSPTGFHTNSQLATKSLALQLQNELAFNANELACSPSNLASGLMIQMPESPAQQSFVVSSSSMQHGYFGPAQTQSQYQHLSQQHPHGPSMQPQLSSPIRKSRSGSSGSESPSPKTTSSAAFHVRKRRTSRALKQSSATPRTPTLGGAVDFVNFTPSDSRKILTGVAPSGSSKTKARREKEAMERRRRLSQAAVRAVRAAGGDVESLVEEGLFV